MTKVLVFPLVLTMYMGVILLSDWHPLVCVRAPHVYGGDPQMVDDENDESECSPCICG